ncbi:MAG: adenylyl-sulfate kinase [Omnitrophica bacterium RIFCSPLOWO2_12_FULL_44_17]|uniref:sulfate adenylyltransferase n=1 Tax=Candidatus Danuiimicrobium aquiferis TaxID=1801832 RepID=A0A1G1KQE9_9BACT|nr:MAG: adenylyl-sulfate kinase [Omnitrophica bacterium RIFCSPHIGHO2_02_FULL_45_28]OGW95153.1 MAG: adenylyl-sulfate kinase [Omnitrophica bacterium RIFCSPLOWO2_12_FULL_44_17]OGX01702.1 MAG: adenylyl-sulfate kinase [Omnitrophica bacterium RIFCSPLOWO2_02_FULL_44_11]
MSREQMNIVIVGHVDHGKSTVIGRLLSDTNSLPEGKLEQVKATCARNAKPFEYAFLLDALKDERSQGITIDIARCFFKTAKRDYIILDAPGHIEFLKNMVTGASRAEAAILVIDAKEGIRENTKRHGLLISMIGIKQVIVLVNKMDLMEYSRDVFESFVRDYGKFLSELNVTPLCYIPVSAFYGDNLVSRSPHMPWYEGPDMLSQLDVLTNKEIPVKLPFRFPVQDIYKFTEEGDDRRILAGTVETGEIHVNDEVLFLPSRKKSRIQSIELFNAPVFERAQAGQAIGFTVTTQLYIPPGEMMVKVSENRLPKISCRFKANVFWVGNTPMIKDKVYKLKVATARVPVKLAEIVRVVDAADLSAMVSQQVVNRHDVATCIFETLKPIAYDLGQDIEGTSRFVIVDHYEIAGGGVILESLEVQETDLERHVKDREYRWDRGYVSREERKIAYSHCGKFILFTGLDKDDRTKVLAKTLERKLFDSGCKAYYLGFENLETGLDADQNYAQDSREEKIRRLGELGRILTDSGQIFVTTMPDLDDYDIGNLKKLISPYEAFVVNVGTSSFQEFKSDLNISKADDPREAINRVCKLLKEKEIIFEYSI